MLSKERRCAAAFVLLTLVAAPWPANAQEVFTTPDDAPHSALTLGVGVGALHFPYYPGATEFRNLLLPFPYVVYHSHYLDVNRDHMRGKLLHSRRFSLEVDFGGAVEVNSAATAERHGMPNLDWIGQAGPALRTHLWHSHDRSVRLDLVLPVRVAVSAHVLTLHHRGEVFAPRLVIARQTGDDIHGLNLNAGLSALYGSRDYFGYLYRVAPQYATRARPMYNAPGGYGGWSAQLGFSLHRGNVVYGSFLSYTDLNGAAFVPSPLVRETHWLSAGFAITWILQRRD